MGDDRGRRGDPFGRSGRAAHGESTGRRTPLALEERMVRHDVSAGGILFVQAHRETVLLLHRRNDTWVMPKGHIEPGETPEQAALREVVEETGVQGHIISKVGTTRYLFHPLWTDAWIDKTVHWYLMDVAEMHVDLEPWFDRALRVYVRDAVTLLTYPSDRAMLRQARGVRARTVGADAVLVSRVPCCR